MPIPRIIHQFWGGDPMPEHYVHYRDRWRELHPDWQVKLWAPGTVPALRHQDLYDRPWVWSPRSDPWMWRSDVFRYEILHTEGGLWVDMDLEPLHPVDELLHGADVVAGREDGTYVANGFLASAPGSAFLTDVLDGLEQRARQRVNMRVNRSIGPHYLTSLIGHHPEVRVLPPEVLYPYHWSQPHREHDDHEGAYTVHHWSTR